jgi:hypothetical protein
MAAAAARPPQLHRTNTAGRTPFLYPLLPFYSLGPAEAGSDPNTPPTANQDRLHRHSQINQPDLRGRITVADLAHHYEQHELGEQDDASIRKPSQLLQVTSAFCGSG